jgi:hypothetical protein
MKPLPPASAQLIRPRRLEDFMKSLISLAALVMFSFAMVGCHASADVDSPDNGTDSHYKKTTTYDNNGTKTTKTETSVNP